MKSFFFIILVTLSLVAVVAVSALQQLESQNERGVRGGEDSMKTIRSQLIQEGFQIAESSHLKQQFPHWFDYESYKKQSIFFSENNNNNKNNNHNHNNNNVTFYESLEFLITFAPKTDLQLPLKYFLENTKYALLSRELFPWASPNKISRGLFLNDVLPYFVFSEPRDYWRKPFFHYFLEKFKANESGLQSMTESDQVEVYMNTYGAWYMSCAVPYPTEEEQKKYCLNGLDKKINYYECPHNYLCSYSPFSTLRARNASCTGQSILLTTCLRSVGVPAKINGVVHWNFCHGKSTCKKCKIPNGVNASAACGDHSWTSSYSTKNRAWNFQDSDGQKFLNHSWFFPQHTDNQVPDTPNHSIYGSSFAPPKLIYEKFDNNFDFLAFPSKYSYPLAWQPHNKDYFSFDVTNYYVTKTKNKQKTSRRNKLKENSLFCVFFFIQRTD